MGVQTMRRSQKDADVCTDAQRASKVGAQAAKSPDSSFTPLSPSSGSARSWVMLFSPPSLGGSLAVRLFSSLHDLLTGRERQEVEYPAYWSIAGMEGHDGNEERH